MKRFLLFLLLLWNVPTLLNGQLLYVHCGNLIDVIQLTVSSEMTIVIENDRIVDLIEGYTDSRDSGQIIDLKDQYCMPGLMDAHVHLEGEGNPNSYLERFTLNEGDVAFRAQEFARRTLMAGFTTVRDLGGSGVNTMLRNAISQGWVVGPRIFSAGKSIATTGGHADPTNGRMKTLMGDPGPSDGVVNSAAEARKAVRQRYKDGADVIKITATGGVLSVAKSGQNPQFTAGELAGIIEAAKDYDMVTAAHAHGSEGMKRAVLAGINSIEHGTYMTDEVMDLMVERGTYYVPTITAGAEVAEKAKIEGYYPDIIVPKALAIGPAIFSTFKKAYAKKVLIAFGTDAGVFKHGTNGKEFGHMVRAGVPALEAIMMATINTSKLLRILDDYGSIEKGKVADIVAVDEDPRENIETMEHVSFVMKGGVVVKNSSNE